MTYGLLLLTPTKKYLFADPRYVEKAKDEAKRGITVVPFDELKTYVKKYKRIRFEANEITIAQMLRWKKNFRGTKLIPSEGVIEEMRRIKKKDERTKMMKACSISDKVMKQIPKMLKVGVSEKDVAWAIEKLSRDLGAEAMSFDVIVGFGDHTARPHHTPTKRKLKKRDVIQIDMGVKIEGYCSDCSRVFFKGKPTNEQRKVFDVVLEAQQASIKAVRSGVTNHALDSAARKVLKREGYEEYLKGAGHGVGLDIHEGPIMSKRAKKQALKNNEIITIEPGIYIDGKWGMRIEDMVLVSKKGGIPLTKVRY